MLLPKVFTENQGSITYRRFFRISAGPDDNVLVEFTDGVSTLVINETKYRLTRHGRKRFCQRAGFKNGKDILLACIDNPKAVWVIGEDGIWYLRTYLSAPKHDTRTSN